MVADLYDGRLARAKEAAGGKIETARDYRRVLDRNDIDAVAIATPDHWHARMVLDALDAGKHVYVEKPLAWSIEQGLQLVAAEKRTGKLVMVGSQSKTAASVAKAREIVKSGLLGKIVMVRMAEHRNSPEGAWVYAIPPDASPQTLDWPRFLGPAPEIPFDAARFFRWRCWWEYSGGVATDLWVHFLTALHEIMDVKAPRSVVAQGGIYRWNDGRTVPDVLSAVYEYDGFVVDIYANLANARGGGAAIVVMGSEATLTFDARGNLVLTFEPATAPSPAPAPDREIAIGPGLDHHEYFVQSLREGLPSKENAEEGHCAAGAAHLANLAFQKGRRMAWDPASGRVTES